VFRRPPAIDLSTFVDIDDVVTCLPVYQEVLQGFRDEPSFRTAREAMSSMTIVESPLGADVFDEAVQLYRTARRAVLTIRSSVDCLIATCAMRHDLEILHLDRDFDALGRIAPLRVRSARMRLA
jgi:predicted nucleic acid-binding protein